MADCKTVKLFLTDKRQNQSQRRLFLIIAISQTWYLTTPKRKSTKRTNNRQGYKGPMLVE